MLKIGVADYGMNVWYGGFMDYEKRMEDIKAIGFDGLERLTPIDAADALNKATTLAKLRMDFATVLAPTLELKVQWTAAFGKEYIWTDVTANHAKDSLDLYCRRVNYLTEACKKYGIKAAVHNHLGCIVETQEQLEEFMEKCPEAGLVFDVGHMAVAGGNDAGPMQRACSGARTVVLSVPCRNIHSPSTVCDLRDADAQYELAKAFLEK